MLIRCSCALTERPGNFDTPQASFQILPDFLGHPRRVFDFFRAFTSGAATPLYNIKVVYIVEIHNIEIWFGVADPLANALKIKNYSRMS